MSKKVLTIDDSKTLRMIIGKHLAPFGIQMFQAENGEQGIVRARETSPDVILLDYNMPIMDGYHTLIELKADPALKPIPVVMLTTETVQDTVIKLVKLGLKDYIAKPFTREVLLAKLNPILNLYDPAKGLPDQPGALNLTPVSSSDKTTILAIDDKSNILDLLKEYLGEQFNVITADCGKTALHAIAHNKFAYMFLDLSMPDINSMEVMDYYLKNGNGASVRRVAAMTLRTAEADIGRAMAAGISTFLHKPFTNEDTKKVIEILAARVAEAEKPAASLHFLASKGKIRILECPPEKSSKYRAVAGALTSDVCKEIDDMAEEGLTQLVIKVGDGFLSDMSITRKFVTMIEHTNRLSLKVRFVADSEQARSALKQFEETASIPTDISLEFALNSMA